MKKTINDLKLQDIIYKQNGTDEIIEYEVIEIGINNLEFRGKFKHRFSRYFRTKPEDYTRWVFRDSNHGDLFFLNLKDALENRASGIRNVISINVEKQREMLSDFKKLGVELDKVYKQIVVESKKNNI